LGPGPGLKARVASKGVPNRYVTCKHEKVRNVKIRGYNKAEVRVVVRVTNHREQ
jgi:hypothetical protein